ncbi:MAG: hypothetical protein MZU95_09820 [Desulfomicrobium escambiense]|nr:hypothetical protein [Desulfomicrobium escambiense]
MTPNTSGRIHRESAHNNSDSLSQDLYTWGSNTSFATGEYKAGNQKATSLNILEAWIQHKGSGLFGIPAGLKAGHMPVIQGTGLFYDHRKFGDDRSPALHRADEEPRDRRPHRQACREQREFLR